MLKVQVRVLIKHDSLNKYFPQVFATKQIFVCREYVGNQRDDRVLSAIIEDEMSEDGEESIDFEVVGFSANCVDCGMRLVSLTDRCQCSGVEVAA